MNGPQSRSEASRGEDDRDPSGRSETITDRHTPGSIAHSATCRHNQCTTYLEDPSRGELHERCARHTRRTGHTSFTLSEVLHIPLRTERADELDAERPGETNE